MEITLAQQQMFERALNNDAEMAKVAQDLGDYIFERVREYSFRDRLLVPQPVAPAEIRSGITEGTGSAVPGQITDAIGDSLYIVREVEVEGKAMIISLRGQPTATYIDGKRFAIPMHTVSTQRFQKTKDELLATQYDLLKVVESTAFMETHRERDKTFLDYCELAIAETGKHIEVSGPIQRSAFESMQHPALAAEIVPTRALMSKVAGGGMNLWDHSDLGDRVYDVATEGWRSKKVGGLEHIESVKSELFDTFDNKDQPKYIEESEMWSFPDSKFLGYNVYCGDYNVWSSWEGRLWRFEGHQTVGLGFGNIKGITKTTIKY